MKDNLPKNNQLWVHWEPKGTRAVCRSDQSLLECACKSSVDLTNICGGVGRCGRCVIQVVTGQTTPVTSGESEKLSEGQIKAGYRLACQTFPITEVKAVVPSASFSSVQRAELEGLEMAFPLKPAVRVFEVQLEPPSLEDSQADDQRLLDCLEGLSGVPYRCTGISTLRNLPRDLRTTNWSPWVITRGSEVLAIRPNRFSPLGVAVDLGTTKIAGYLIGLENGSTLASRGIMNPQIRFGEDILTRLSRAQSSPKEGLLLQKILMDALNSLCEDLCAEAQVDVSTVTEWVIAGNTAMHHLLLRLPVESLARSPYVPAVIKPLEIQTHELGLVGGSPAAVYLLPNIGGYVGGDHVATLLATEEFFSHGTTLILDIGTNTEVCLIREARMTSVSCPSGPAFEGGHIKDGMRASNGAIEHVKLVEDVIVTETIGHVPPIGICGSGMLDLMAEMKRTGVMDRTGRLLDHPLIRMNGGVKELVLVNEDERPGLPAVTLTQKDVRQLQLAKAAIRAGIEVLLESEGCSAKEINHVAIGGAFGSNIHLSSAVNIGMLPLLPIDRFLQVGNSAGVGARMALLSVEKREHAWELARKTRYLELASARCFTELFTRATAIEPATRL